MNYKNFFAPKKETFDIKSVTNVLNVPIDLINLKLAATQGYGVEQFQENITNQIQLIHEKIEQLKETMQLFEAEVSKLLAEDRKLIIQNVYQYNQKIKQLLIDTTQAFSFSVQEIEKLRKEVEKELSIMHKISVELITFNKEIVTILRQRAQQPTTA
ncbi:MAG: hypothetical protein ACMXYF_05580 [Candidatus Woesearchaeota archaeon]